MSLTTALLPSMLAIALLALRDPKRLRHYRSSEQAWPTSIRLAIKLLALLPGMVLLLSAQWPLLLIWLSLVCLFGWALALLFNVRD